MAINYEEIKDGYLKKLNESGLFEQNNLSISATIVQRKKQTNFMSIVFDVINKNNVDESMSFSMYIVDKNGKVLVLFVNDDTHEIIFNYFGENALSKAEKYIEKYIERSVRGYLGLEIEEIPKKDRHSSHKHTRKINDEKSVD